MGAVPNPGSTLQSIRRGQRTEIDYLNGAVVRAGPAGRGRQAPVNAALMALVHEVEAWVGSSCPDEVLARPPSERRRCLGWAGPTQIQESTSNSGDHTRHAVWERSRTACRVRSPEFGARSPDVFHRRFPNLLRPSCSGRAEPEADHGYPQDDEEERPEKRVGRSPEARSRRRR